MNKIFAAVNLLVGTVAASTKSFVKSYDNQDSPRQIINLGDLFITTYDYNFDLEIGHFELGFNFTNIDLTPFAISLEYTTPLALAFGDNSASQ